MAGFLFTSIIIGIISIVIIKKRGGNNDGDKCPDLYKLGVLKVNFNPAFLSFDKFNDAKDSDTLVITSFFNVKFDVSNTPPRPPIPMPYAPDLVARLSINENESFNKDTFTDKVEVLTDKVPAGPPKTVWPNEAIVVPAGEVFPFEGLIIAQGFIGAAFPGRLSVLDLSTPSNVEYIIQQSSDDTGRPRFYHNSVFWDMDGDGLKDIVTVRSSIRVFPRPNPPSGELVWFRNPGAENLKKDVEWEETILLEGALGPDIYIKSYDFGGNGIPHFLCTHFFTGEKITIYGVSGGKDWPAITKGEATMVSVDISTDQGKPFGVDIVDLDGDGRVEVLATNHQADDCNFPTDIPGRVYAIIPPTDNAMFYDASAWTTRILLDDIYPQPSTFGARISRLAPGNAITFYSSRKEEEKGGRPWIVVGGDEAGKVWIFRPVEKKGWEYDIDIIFDINDFYGKGTTQTEIPTKPLITISTMGTVSVRYDRSGRDGMAEIYIPVFEGEDIHVYSFREPGRKDMLESIECLDDVKIECSTPPFTTKSTLPIMNKDDYMIRSNEDEESVV